MHSSALLLPTCQLGCRSCMHGCTGRRGGVPRHHAHPGPVELGSTESRRCPFSLAMHCRRLRCSVCGSIPLGTMRTDRIHGCGGGDGGGGYRCPSKTTAQRRLTRPARPSHAPRSTDAPSNSCSYSNVMATLVCTCSRCFLLHKQSPLARFILSSTSNTNTWPC